VSKKSSEQSHAVREVPVVYGGKDFWKKNVLYEKEKEGESGAVRIRVSWNDYEGVTNQEQKDEDMVEEMSQSTIVPVDSVRM